MMMYRQKPFFVGIEEGKFCMSCDSDIFEMFFSAAVVAERPKDGKCNLSRCDVAEPKNVNIFCLFL